MRLFGEIHTVDYIPTVQYLPGKQTARNKIAQNREDMFEFYREVIDEHKRTYDPENIRDLIDTYLAEIEKAKIEGRELFDGRNHGKLLIFMVFFSIYVFLVEIVSHNYCRIIYTLFHCQYFRMNYKLLVQSSLLINFLLSILYL